MPYDRDQSLRSEMNFHKEAADFYVLYRAGVPVDRIRADIEVPGYVVDAWTQLAEQEGDRTAQEALRVMVPFRAKVLERFEAMVAGAVSSRADRRGRPRDLRLVLAVDNRDDIT